MSEGVYSDILIDYDLLESRYEQFKVRKKGSLDIFEIENVVKKITYKPNWVIQIHAIDPFAKFITFRIHRYTRNSEKMTQEEYFTSEKTIDYPNTKEELLISILGVIQWVELHELSEFLRFENKLFMRTHDQKSEDVVFPERNQYEIVNEVVYAKRVF